MPEQSTPLQPPASLSPELWPEREAAHPDVAPLARVTTTVHDEALAASGRRDTCIFTSAALVAVLEALGYAASMARVEVAVFAPDRRQIGTVLGSFGDGTRRPAAAPGKWAGHVAVLVTAGPHGDLPQPILCDPTMDQAEGLVDRPVAVRVPQDWWAPGGRVRLRWESGVFGRVDAHPERRGWLSAPDYRAAAGRRPVVAACLQALRTPGDA
jgi:hypothetical protein